MKHARDALELVGLRALHGVLLGLLFVQCRKQVGLQRNTQLVRWDSMCVDEVRRTCNQRANQRTNKRIRQANTNQPINPAARIAIDKMVDCSSMCWLAGMHGSRSAALHTFLFSQ